MDDEGQGSGAGISGEPAGERALLCVLEGICGDPGRGWEDVCCCLCICGLSVNQVTPLNRGPFLRTLLEAINEHVAIDDEQQFFFLGVVVLYVCVSYSPEEETCGRRRLLGSDAAPAAVTFSRASLIHHSY